MARLATTTDVFNAVAEPGRRRILSLLTDGERSVNDVARALRIRQPQVSKHLSVLRRVGLVRVRGAGQRRLYAIRGDGLKPMYDWVRAFERFWGERLDRLADYLDELQSTDTTANKKKKGDKQ